MSVLDPSSSRNFTAKPRPSRAPSCASGSADPFENRISTGITTPGCRCAAVVSAAASPLERKVPDAPTPLAWSTRRPGCTPDTACTCSIR